MREKMLLRRRVAPKRVTLPDRQSFVARFEIVSKTNLPTNITVNKYVKLDRDNNRELKKVELL